jgi:chemotaxis signal transduction protein
MKPRTRTFDWNSIKLRLQGRIESADHDSPAEQSHLEKVFRARMLEYAHRSADESKRSARRRVLACAIGARDFGIELALVQKVLPLSQCVPVPGAPEEVVGVVNIAGEIYSVVDAAALIGATSNAALPNRATSNAPLPTDASSSDLLANGCEAGSHVVLLRHGEIVVGFKVDYVKAIELIDDDKIFPPGETANSTVRFVRGLTANNLFVLDMKSLMSHSIFNSETICQ